MQNFKRIFNKQTSIIGMIHINPLPGTPAYRDGSFAQLIEKAKHEAFVYVKSRIDAILVENMHDIPYIKSARFGPEIVAAMTAATIEIKKIIEQSNQNIPLGVQVLACGGKEALAIAKATQCNFIRNEGFVFSHIGDEGFIDSNAGEILRYRKMIDADDVLIFSDIKKKHSSHALTSDVTLLETAFAAKFFKCDGIILTGRSTGDTTDLDELNAICQQRARLDTPILVGSGVTKQNLKDYMGRADAIIVGSDLKSEGHWANELSEERVVDFMNCARMLSK